MISVIITAYNIEKYLEQCLESVLRQTYRDLEIIIVDDCSTDGTPALCDRLALRDSRISVIHLPENKGISNTRNVGIKAAQGEYIYMIDGDDFIHPKMLEVLFNSLDGTDYDFSMVYGVRVPKDTGIDYIADQNIDINKISRCELDQRELMSSLCGHGWLQFVVVWNKLFRRELIDGVDFLPTASQDSNWIFRVAMKTRKVIVLNEEMYAWRQHEASITHQRVNFRRVDCINSYLLSYRAIAEAKPEYKSCVINRMYREIFLVKYLAKGTDVYSLAKQFAADAHREVCGELLRCRDIKWWKKIKITLFYHFPSLYRLYMAILKRFFWH